MYHALKPVSQVVTGDQDKQTYSFFFRRFSLNSMQSNLNSRFFLKWRGFSNFPCKNTLLSKLKVPEILLCLNRKIDEKWAWPQPELELRVKFHLYPRRRRFWAVCCSRASWQPYQWPWRSPSWRRWKTWHSDCNDGLLDLLDLPRIFSFFPGGRQICDENESGAMKKNSEETVLLLFLLWQIGRKKIEERWFAKLKTKRRKY